MSKKSTQEKLYISSHAIHSIATSLGRGNKKYNQQYTGESTGRQPTHTVYGGAQIFSGTVAKKMGESALSHLNDYFPNASAICECLDIQLPNAKIWETVYQRTVAKLKSEPVEDFRIDFEDGYGNRPNAEEDEHARLAALEVARGMKDKSLPPFLGIRIKPFNDERFQRSVRTLNIFLTTLLKASGNRLPTNFVVTLPKVQCVEQAIAFHKALEEIEKSSKLKKGTLECELMIETPQSILNFQGVAPIRSFVKAMNGRCRGAHFGTYDYTAGCNITAEYQSMMNPVCDFAKHVMQVSLAGTPVMLSDGATNIMPVPLHRGEKLSESQQRENMDSIKRAWRLSYKHILHSLETGYYQGWDLHPAQLPIRYIATYSFFLQSYMQAASRLQGFVEKAARATLMGDVFDDAATGQGLLNYFLRGMSCGAITEAEAFSTGLTSEDFNGRSFLKILERRKLA